MKPSSFKPSFFAITVGTSILANAAREGIVPEAWSRLAPDDPRQEEAERGPVERLVEFAVADPERCCAELNTVAKVAKRWPPLFRRARAALYASDTGAGRLAARALEGAFCRAVAKLGVAVEECTAEVKVVPGLGRDFSRSLGELARAVARDVKCAKARGMNPYVVATGGYKPESTFAVVAAYLAGALDVFYIHESFRDVVSLGLLPIDLHPAARQVARGEAEPEDLAKAWGVDPHHLVELGVLAEEARRRTLAPHIAALIDALEAPC